MEQRRHDPSPLIRTLTRLTAVCFAVLGAMLFVAPGWSAGHFPWEQYPFVAMTMGGWYLGGALFAWEATRLRRWDLTYSCHLYLWSFSLLETAVLVALHHDIELGAPLTWPYLVTLAVGLLTAAVGLLDLACTRPALHSAGLPVPWWLRGLTVGFVLFVAFLALVLLTGLSRGTMIRGEPLEPITAHAFGAFYLALMLGTLPLSWAPTMAPFRAHLRVGLALTVLLFSAAVVHHAVFNLQVRPAGLLYFAAYLVVGCGSALILGTLNDRRDQNTSRLVVPLRG